MIGRVAEHIAQNIPQVELRWLGGLKTIAGRLTFYVGFLNLAMLIPVAYYNTPAIQWIFPNVFAFIAAVVLSLGLAAIIEYSIIFPSQIKFDKKQAVINDRDPIFREARRARRAAEEAQKTLEKLEHES